MSISKYTQPLFPDIVIKLQEEFNCSFYKDGFYFNSENLQIKSTAMLSYIFVNKLISGLKYFLRKSWLYI